MIVCDKLVQGSDAWISERLGVLTASQIDGFITPTGKLSGQRKKLAAKLIAERILREPVETFQGSYWTDRGKEFEGEAGAYFSLMTDLEPQAVGFVYRDDSKECGCSPDWLVPDPGGDWIAGVEVKCPDAPTHVQYLLDDQAEKYTPQVQYSLWVTGLPVWFFLSYYPGMRPLLREVKPDPLWQAAFSEYAPLLLREVRQGVEKLTRSS